MKSRDYNGNRQLNLGHLARLPLAAAGLLALIAALFVFPPPRP